MACQKYVELTQKGGSNGEQENHVNTDNAYEVLGKALSNLV
jgi:hypothetical protein